MDLPCELKGEHLFYAAVIYSAACEHYRLHGGLPRSEISPLITRRFMVFPGEESTYTYLTSAYIDVLLYLMMEGGFLVRDDSDGEWTYRPGDRKLIELLRLAEE